MSNFLTEFSLAEQLSVSYLIGRAGGTAVEPLLVGLRQSAYLALLATNAFEVPNAIFLAQGVAQGQIDPKVAAEWARFQGFGATQFDAMVAIANTGPPLASALTLLRRGVWTPTQYETALNRQAIESQWYQGLLGLQDVWLTPEELAVMVQRGVVNDPGYLPVGPPSAVGKVPPMPVAQIDTAKEAAGGGADFERMAARARIIGLPASPDLAARMTFRKIIDRVDFDRAISEGNTRNEWAPFLFEGFRQIPTAEQFVEAHLRGWITQKEMYDGTALHGMSPTHTDLEFQIHRRPLTPHAIKQALARGGTFNPEPGEIQNPYEASVHQANLGPEWYDLAVHLAGSYPSLFITNRLVTGGTISADTGKQWLQNSGLADPVVTAMYDSWTGTAGQAADKHVAKAQTSLWTTTHKSYIAEEIDDATATTALTAAGVTAAAIPAILTLWKEERALIRKQLSPTQIRKAINLGVVNPATGVAWTVQDGITALLARGYDQADATVFLQE